MAGDGREALRVDANDMRTVGGDGIRPRIWLLALGICLAGAAFIAAIRLAGAGAPEDKSRASAREPVPRSVAAREDPSTAAGAVKPQRAIEPVRHAAVRPRAVSRPAPAAGAPPVGAMPAEEQAPPAEAPADEPLEGDQPTGIALFPPPGTDPIKRGIVVPEGFELPEGYVRHYQVTDDGEPLPAILMFHPDYEFVDEHGAAVAIPADHIVPPEMAPAGLAIQMLEVPGGDAPAAEPKQGETERAP